ncbi:MAG: protein kinase [Deltaproteobacteria bacterium]|nr:protein kinase [Deltaproteobacteria bacterium]
MTEPPATRRELTVDQVDGYRIEQRIGEGGMGVVYLARDLALDRPLALKVLFDLTDAENIERFNREARALARLSHPNVVQVYALGTVQGFPYFAMEYVDGVGLDQVLDERGALVVDEAIGYALQAARGLAAAAQAGVVHRDVKPHNLLLTADGVIKLVDFGLARIGGQPSRYTTRSAAMGTPHYMAPEQARGEAIDERSDQYALGATLYHLLCGRPPFEAQSDVALLLKHQQEPPPPLPARAPQVPALLWQVIARMLAKQPDRRFASHDQVIEALLDAAEPPSAATPALPPSARPERRLLIWFGVGAGALLALLGLLKLTLVIEQPGAAAPASAPGQLTLGHADDGRASAAAPAPAEPPAVSRPASRPADTAGLIEQLQRGTHEQRLAAMAELAASRDAAAVEALTGVLASDIPEEGLQAAQLLGEIGDQRATPALLEALRSPRRELVLAAISALLQLRDLRAVEPLQELSRTHRDRAVRSAATAARQSLFVVEER